MKVLLSILLVLAVANVAVSWDEGLRVKFNVGLNPSSGEDYFFKVPRTIAEALEDGWKRTKRPSGPLEQLSMYCPSDKILCALYDDFQDIAGLQIALPKCQFNSYFDWETRGLTKWNTVVDDQCRTFLTTQQYFVSEGRIPGEEQERNSKKKKQEKNKRQAIRKSGRLLKENAVWVTGINQELVKVSNSEEDIKETAFKQQACIPWMGKHYYYNMTSELPCTADSLFPWFPLTVDGELVATGFLAVGSMPIEEDQRDWFERPGSTVVKLIVPDGPECLYDLADDIGVLTMHIYYIDNPWGILLCG